MGALDGLYEEKRLTMKEYEEIKKRIAVIPPTKWEKENPESLDYSFYSREL